MYCVRLSTTAIASHKRISQTTRIQEANINSQSNSQRDYLLTWSATFLFFIAYYALIVPLPRYLSGVGLADWQVGLVLGASGVASLVLRPLSGLFADRVGYKPMLLLGALALMVGATSVVFTGNVVLLFCLRIVQTIGYVIFTTSGNALVGHLSSAEERSSKIAYFGLAANFAMTVTPGITDLVLPQIGISPVFWIAGSVAVVAGVLTQFLRFVPVKNEAKLANGAGESGSSLWHFPVPLRMAMLVAVLFGAGYGAYIQYFAVLLDRREIIAYPVYATYGLSIITTRLLLGRYLDRIGLGRVLTIAAFLMAVGLTVAAFGTSVQLLVVAAALIAVGGGFFHPMLIAHHVSLLPSRPAWAVACFYFGFDAGIGLGAWLLGVVLDWSGLTTMYLVATGLTLLTLIFIPAMIRKREQEGLDHAS